MNTIPARSVWTDPIMLLATGGGLGTLGVASGTLGALVGLPLSYVVLQLPWPTWQVVALAALCAVGVPVCGYAGKKLGEKDPSAVIWDEIVTVPLVYLAAPVEELWQPSTIVIGFVLHRLFDITKPPPLRYLERLPGGWGIMLDDVGAALYAALVLRMLL